MGEATKQSTYNMMRNEVPVLFVLDLFPLQRNFVKEVAVRSLVIPYIKSLTVFHWEIVENKV